MPVMVNTVLRHGVSILNDYSPLSCTLQKLQDNILDDADLAGPLFFCLMLGSCLLLAGKVTLTI